MQPSESAKAFTVELAAGNYTIQWYSANSREAVGGGKVAVEAAGPTVLYLKKVSA